MGREVFNNMAFKQEKKIFYDNLLFNVILKIFHIVLSNSNPIVFKFLFTK